AVRPKRRAVLSHGNRRLAMAQRRQRGAGTSAAQGKIAAALGRRTCDVNFFIRVKRQRLAGIAQFRAGHARLQQSRDQAGTVSAKTWNSVAVKLSWSAGLTTPWKKCSDICTSWPMSITCRNSGDDRRGQVCVVDVIAGGQGSAAPLSG